MWEKTAHEVLSTGTEGTVFPYTDRPGPVNKVFFFSAFLKMNEANWFANSLFTYATSYDHISNLAHK